MQCTLYIWENCIGDIGENKSDINVRVKEVKYGSEVGKK